MIRRVILITGTPCVGKTLVSKLLATRLGARYVNLTELSIKENLVLGMDNERQSLIVDEKGMKRRIGEIVRDCEKNDMIVDGHYAARAIPKRYVTYVFVLRRNPIELRKFMEKKGFSGRKLWENLASEILDVCLVEAIEMLDEDKVCELDASDKSVEEVVDEILRIFDGREKCRVGCVDWLGMLEKKRLLEEYLRI